MKSPIKLRRDSCVRSSGVDIFEPGSEGTGGKILDPYLKGTQARIPRTLKMRPSEWVSRFVRIQDGGTGAVQHISFKERGYLRRLYDSPARKRLYMTSRQTEKSTTLGNLLMALSGMNPGYPMLFVTPSAIQTTGFSKTRIDGIVEISPMLKAMTPRGDTTWNLLEKTWLNRAKIYLRYAFLNADRIRGLSVGAIFGDEIQDLLTDVMPVIEETASHFASPLKVYSGTPKTLDNSIESYWSDSSTQNEWAIPCERHGTPGAPHTWHWNILGVKNLGLKGPICDKCGGPLVPAHPLARWVSTGDRNAEFEGYRICRLMVPWFVNNPVKWREILEVHKRYPTAQFLNEVMAIAYDSGVKPISVVEITRCCDPTYENTETQALEISKSTPTFAGIDWGTGAQAYTVLTIASYCRTDSSLQIIYMKRYDEGDMADPEVQLADIRRLITLFRCRIVGADYGMGFYQNKVLTSAFGSDRIRQFQYAARSAAKVAFSPKLGRYIVFRTPLMSDIFHALKRLKIRLPAWPRIIKPFASDIRAIYSEYSETQKMIRYNKTRAATDDTFHSILYAVLASMFVFPRPDIIAPMQAASGQGGKEEQAMEAAELAAMEELDDLAPVVGNRE